MNAGNFLGAVAIGSAVGFVASAGWAAKKRSSGLGFAAAAAGAVLGGVAGYALGFVACIVLGSSLLVSLVATTGTFFWVVTIGSAIGAVLLGIALVDHATRSS